MQDGMLSYPSIAQLAERETVEAKQLSLGHWFESGWTETFFQVQLSLPSSPWPLEIWLPREFMLNTLATPLVRRFGIFSLPYIKYLGFSPSVVFLLRMTSRYSIPTYNI